MRSLVAAGLGLLLFAGCVRPPVIPIPPTDVRSLTIQPPRNRTGDDLLVAGGSLLEQYALRSERVTVPDVLADETEALLRARGYQVTVERGAGARASTRTGAPEIAPRPGAVEGLVLDLEVRRWEPNSWTHPDFVIVGVSATLRDGGTGREVWSASLPVYPIATPNVVVLGTAYEIAARAIVAELLASWPARP